MPDPRHRGRGRLQRGGPREPRRAPRRRGDLHRSGGRAAVVPVGPGRHLRGRRDGLRRDPSRLRLPVRGRDVRRGRRGAWPDVHRPAARGPRPLRQQGGNPPPARRFRAPDDPRLGRHAPRRRARARGGRPDRLPGPHQALGRRRGQGHAHGPHPAGARVGDQGLPLRGEVGLRRRLALPREVAR